MPWHAVMRGLPSLIRCCANAGAGLCSKLAPLVTLPACRNLVLLNKGIGATNSGIFSACAEKLVPQVGSGVYYVACSRRPHGTQRCLPGSLIAAPTSAE